MQQLNVCHVIPLKLNGQGPTVDPVSCRGRASAFTGHNRVVSGSSPGGGGDPVSSRGRASAFTGHNRVVGGSSPQLGPSVSQLEMITVK